MDTDVATEGSAAEWELVRLAEPADLRQELGRDARTGLTARPKELPPKYFYDARGSELFDRITRLPAYYPTRTETAILERHAESIVASIEPHELIEIGSGYSRKTQILIEALERHGGTRYVGMDVSEDALRHASERLTSRHPELDVTAVVCDFEDDFSGVERRGRRLVSFLGSTIGNLDAGQRADLLRRIRAMLQPEDRFLLGLDLVKDPAVLEAAYNDPGGLTAEFNLNVLRVLNRELDGDLPLDAFEHRAFYDRDLDRIEMRLRATRPVRARLEAVDLDVTFDEGEELRTEISCKFRRDGVRRELERAGFSLDRWHTDEANAFGVALAAPA